MKNHINLRKKENGNGSFIVAHGNFNDKKWNFIDFDYLESISPGNKGFFAEMMKIFKSESQYHIRKMNEQLLQKDFYALARTAHAMKPTGTYVGVNSLTALMGKLEKVASEGNDENIQELLAETQNIVASVNQEIDEYLSVV